LTEFIRIFLIVLENIGIVLATGILLLRTADLIGIQRAGDIWAKILPKSIEGSFQATQSPWSRQEWAWVIAAPMVYQVLFFAAVHVILRNEFSSLTFDSFLKAWAGWDAVHYLNIASNGYLSSGATQKSIVFFPLFPWCVSAISSLGFSVLHAALLLNFALGPVMVFTIVKLGEFDYPRPRVIAAALLLVVLPSSFSQMAPYTERLFITLLCAALCLMRKGRWLFALLTTFLLGLTRPTGVALLPAFVAEYLLIQRATGKRGISIGRDAVVLLGIPCAFVCYLYLNDRCCGGPFAYMAFQREYWHRQLAPFWTGINVAFQIKLTDFRTIMTREIAETAAIFISTIFLLISSLRQRLTYALIIWGVLILGISSTWVLSMPRYVSVLFPIAFIYVHFLEKRKWALALTVAVFVPWAVLYGVWFAQRHWAF